MEQPDTLPQTGNKQLDKYNKKLHRQTKNKITDEFIHYRKDRGARVRQQKLEQKLEEAARRKAEPERRAKEAAEAVLTPKQKFKRQVKACRKEMAEKVIKLLPDITAPIQQQATHNTPTHKCNHIIMDPEAQESIESCRKETRLELRHIYSYGSMVDKEKETCAMAFADAGEEQTAVKGTTGGFASSTKAELMGLIAGIIATTQGQDLCIRLGNQMVGRGRCQSKTSVDERKTEVRLRCRMGGDCTNIRRVHGVNNSRVRQGPQRKQMERKGGHGATVAQSQGGTAWEVDGAAQDDIKYSATMTSGSSIRTRDTCSRCRPPDAGTKGGGHSGGPRDRFNTTRAQTGLAPFQIYTVTLFSVHSGTHAYAAIG